LNEATDSVTAAQGTPGGTPWLVRNVSQLVPESYDYIGLDYTGSDLTTVVYKQGGSGGTVVATLSLTYSGSNLTSVTRS
jgi:hypothetical protein